ncbi:hypothetical protein G1H11_17760 [Phytoactinopolyspora alkaliphila]|uniref:Asparagine synthetase domain-containing protein n=1 Tax=Phytoactinopolyspora alkaliphila TaxID=1783498 RepID=A0A6N9YQM6_9ACTN|nr:asparagine synthase-related protein [Phytoactinopolyspora alkaliphila]NED97148.1 hypothetical protein [Phytoactinopolyspora alkaliphila]
MQVERSRRAIGMCGRAGPGDATRVDTMSELLGGVRSLFEGTMGALRADAGAVRWPGTRRSAVSWSPTPLPANLPPDAAAAAEHHDAFSLVTDPTSARMYAGVSGAVPVYADMDAGTSDGVFFCTRLEPLARTRGASLRPDWHAWAHILAAGGPLEGRTTFAGIHRLQPWSRVSVEAGGRPAMTASGWPWLEVAQSGSASVDAVGDALAHVIAELSSRSAVASLLSGGWDSRILAALAARSAASPGATGDPLVAWTTSSDTGTVMEELVAAKVAEHLGVRHRVLPPRHEAFAEDLDYFARSADYQTSFHVWLVPLARALVGSSATVLDGLGGGLFVGGAFPDDESGRPAVDQRFDRLARYLKGAEEILAPGVVAQVRERTWAAFEQVAEPLAKHPFGSTFTAYLTRTLPGISLAPYGLMASSAPVATPFVNNAVVTAALAIPPELHRAGRLYPQLIRRTDAYLAELPTAADLTPRERQLPRRVSSEAAARHLRDLVTREPVRELLAPGLAGADIGVWRRHLDNTRHQHLIRGLATLSLWLDHYADVLSSADVDELMGRG